MPSVEHQDSSTVLTDDELRTLHAHWRAANYLAAGQIYLMSNPLLTEPLRPEHIKPRLLGHWGTSPGLNLVYTHLNRVIKARGLDALCVWGPGHGGPAVLAGSWLEGSYSETYPDVSRDATGMDRLFRQFSFPGGVPSHVAPETPGSIHEGGELGYSLAHAYGAAFDNPDLLVACVIGDGEAETGPLAAAWHSNKFLDPLHDGAVLPILHLNGYKIANPTVLSRLPESELDQLLRGYGHVPIHVTGDDPMQVHRAMAAAFDQALEHIALLQASAREDGVTERVHWPVILLRTPKGWTGPAEVDGVPVEGTWRAHQVPLSGVRENPDHLRQLEAWLRSYRPEELFDADGRPTADVLACVPEGAKRLGSTSYANGGLLVRELPIPSLDRFAVPVDKPGVTLHEPTRILGDFLEQVMHDTAERRDFRVVGPDETASNRLQAVFNASGKAWQAEHLPVDEHLDRHGRVMEILSEHTCQGWLEGYLLTGRHGLFLLLRSLRPHRRLDGQPAHQVAAHIKGVGVAGPDRLPQLPADVPCLAPGPQRLLAPGPRLRRPRPQQEPRGRPGVPAAGRQHPAVGGRSRPAQPRLRQRDRRGQTALLRLAVPGPGPRPLRPRRRDLGLGGHRERRRTGCRAGLRR